MVTRDRGEMMAPSMDPLRDRAWHCDARGCVRRTAAAQGRTAGGAIVGVPVG